MKKGVAVKIKVLCNTYCNLNTHSRAGLRCKNRHSCIRRCKLLPRATSPLVSTKIQMRSVRYKISDTRITTTVILLNSSTSQKQRLPEKTLLRAININKELCKQEERLLKTNSRCNKKLQNQQPLWKFSEEFIFEIQSDCKVPKYVRNNKLPAQSYRRI